MRSESKTLQVGELAGMNHVSIVSIRNVGGSALEVRCVSNKRVPFDFLVGDHTPFAKKLISLGIAVRGPVIADFDFGSNGTTIENVVPILPQKRASS